MNQLDLNAFERLVDIHGSDLDRWPAALRESVDEVLRTTDAQRLLRQSQALDALLNDVPVPATAGRDMRGRILGSVRVREAGWVDGFLDWIAYGSWGLRPAALALVPLLIGLGLGLGMNPTSTDDSLADEFTLLAFEHIEDYDDAQ